MKTKATLTPGAGRTRTLPSRLRRICIALATACLSSMSVTAQTSRTYSNGNHDFKNYAVLTDGAAGTIYNASASRYLAHYAYMDHAGTILRSVFYDNLQSDDDRVADLSLLPNGNRIITVATHNVVRKQNNIRLLYIQADGKLLKTIDINDAGDLIDYYPMSSLVDGETLYICGYTLPNRKNGGPAGPVNYTNGRNAFVMSFDLTSQTVTNTNNFYFTSSNFYYTYGGNGNPTYDYTIALRMKMIDIPRSGQYLMVTGGANYFKPSNLWPGGGLDECVGGTMIAMFDPTTLWSTYHSSIASVNADINTDVVEYGMGLHYDPIDSKLYIQGNYAHALNGPDGFNTQAIKPFLQAVDIPFLTPSATGSLFNDRTDFLADNSWGLQTIEDANNPGTLTIQGLQTQEVRSCPFLYPRSPATDNVNPFLMNITPSYTSGGISTTLNDWTMIPSVKTTGAAPNGYYKLGGGDQIIAWAPKMMADMGGEYRLIAPIWEPNSNRLEFKSILMDPTRHIMDCEDIDFRCDPLTATSKCDSISATQVFYQNLTGTLINDPQLFEVAVNFNEVFCDRYENKPTFVSTAQPEITAAIYPNPANSTISLKLTGFANEDNTDVVLIDMAGRTVDELYSGTAAAMPKQLSLSSIANGVYQVSIIQNGRSIRKEKLTVLH